MLGPVLRAVPKSRARAVPRAVLGIGSDPLIRVARSATVPPRSAKIYGVAVTAAEARAIALSLPEAVEQDHHGRPSFRVRGRIFATLWNEDRMNVMVDEDGIRTGVERAPETCEPVWWGKRLTAVAVTLSAVERPFLGELLADAWEGKAPRRLLPDR